ncbi:Uncharacterised protein [Mycoplasmopsis edwardii]|uniref:Uncharacterized protein n=1 Tax=Mycoplasmopsis edwardii TaxID=53558 RepID=A0A3B0PI02_9BACT|nr:Uncharacterised protein [Mycoplasmopsis edwardii]
MAIIIIGINAANNKLLVSNVDPNLKITNLRTTEATNDQASIFRTSKITLTTIPLLIVFLLLNQLSNIITIHAGIIK